MMLKLAGYKEANLIYTGIHTLVYRSLRTCDRKPVIIKVMNDSHPNFNALVKFRNQYVITRHLEHPKIVQPLSLERYENGYALVMPDDGAIALSDYWQKSNPSLTEFMSLAIQIAESLHFLTQQRIIHKDIKPSNILVHPETHQIKLIDFSISSLLPKENQQMLNPKGLEGTLAYISPEQTGRMNRGIDYRTDFYSLGVTFFELLTGKFPFDTKEPMELVHCHIAQKVKFPVGGSQLEVPEVLQRIVLKLMEKNAEDRYQSAFGLKYDLERCLQQLTATGEISPFQLGERDRSDRFITPEKLYGREKEVQTLLDTFSRVAKGAMEMILVAGFSGVGKTAVINEVHKPILKQRGYLIKGKFDQFNRNVPLSAFVQAFRDLIKQLLSESDADLANWKAKIMKAVQESGQVIIDVIPELENIIGQQPPVPELSSSAAQNRFNFIFSKFIHVFTTQEHPLVIFLDDLQWADLASLKLLKLLMAESETGYFMVMGAYRDHEVFPTHSLMLTLEQIQKEGGKMNTMTLTPLNEANINLLVADTLLCGVEIAAPLSQLVYQKTKGNPFFTIQFLQGLHEEGYITFDLEAGYWQCDLAKVRRLALTDDVVVFMEERLRKLPPETQAMLMLAASIGNRFNLATLAVVCECSQDDVAANLWMGLQEGFVIPESQNYKFVQGEKWDVKGREEVGVDYRFLHDRVQQAAYALIPKGQKQHTHLQNGRLLLKKSSTSEIEENIFDVTNQFNKGHFFICDHQEKDKLAQLNLRAGRKAKSATAYSAATDYLNFGILLLEDGWERQYDLMLSLYLEAIESEYMTTNFELSQELSNQALEKVESLLDRLKIYELQIRNYNAQNQRQQAVDLGIYGLKLLNLELDTVPPDIDDIEALIDLPEMSDPLQIMALRILVGMVSAACVVALDLLAPITYKLVNICVDSGNSQLAPYAYSCYSWILSNSTEEIDTCYRFGKLAMKVLEKFDAREVKCKVYQQFNSFARHRKEPLEKMGELVDAIHSGIEVGDLEYVGYSVQNYCAFQFLRGKNLESCLSEQKKYIDLIRRIRQEYSANIASVWLQVTSNLLGESVNEYSRVKEDNDNISLFPILYGKIYLNYLFEQYLPARESALMAEKIATESIGFVYYPSYLFYFSLTLLADYPQADTEAQQGFLARVKKHQKRLLNLWVNGAPFTHQHKYDLVQAEYYRVLENKMEAIELYDRAIAGARENEYIQEEALANELAAKFYLDWGKAEIASFYMQEAYYCYTYWGAKAKTEQLEEKYPQLLKLILQKQWIESNSPKSLDLRTETLVSNLYTQSNKISTLEPLDLASILQAAQSISSTIELNQLLADISRIILTNSGAQKTVLLIPQDDQWQLRAMARLANDGTIETSTKSLALTPESTVPIRLIQYVKNTQESVLINAAQTDIYGVIEGYLLEEQPQSVLCVPLLSQGDLVAILYLEHPTTKDVFTHNRQTIVQFLCAQAAIALKNAQLYEQAQQALRDLQQAQLQIVQSEKMSALGNLVSGVAHEINNPTGFIEGNIKPAQEYVQDLLGLIDLYQSEYPQPSEAIVEEIEAIDLEFLFEDLPKLLKSMNLGVERIHNISNSLRTFSRKDQDHKVRFNIHEGIDSTLVILNHRTKANKNRPEIVITKEYGEIPEVECLPGQLNQVFMNILANAVDALEEGNQGKTYREIDANPNCIMIYTSLLAEDRVQIRIQDNGSGMKPETQKRIFEQGFTTKEVGKGTGLGMAIAHQIITEKHGGTITCDSTLGKGTTFTITLPISELVSDD